MYDERCLVSSSLALCCLLLAGVPQPISGADKLHYQNILCRHANCNEWSSSYSKRTSQRLLKLTVCLCVLSVPSRNGGVDEVCGQLGRGPEHRGEEPVVSSVQERDRSQTCLL